MNAHQPIRALIAEDEPILAAVLAASLQRLWPGLEVVGTAPNGLAAVEQALALRPDVLFLDIKMPGQTGLEAAEELAERWDGAQPFPEVVFVTAYDDYALKAFEQAAADYVLKPVSDERLRRTVERLRARLQTRVQAGDEDGGIARLVEQMRALLPQASAPERLSTIRAAVGNMVRMIPVQEVVYFQALDKYVNVATLEGDALIRLPLKELMAQLDPARFCQVSRSSIVNMKYVASASRDEMGKLSLALRGRTDRLKVSPLFAHLFRQM
ncbi:LytR family transcriptional regulator [Massilia sp. WF1]|uniref:LytR/AlgR family response regulator transcription factor n=1 Tax=unclassified Massilia TaxID=2609279 RepID=UPI00064999CD|nr:MULTISPECIES: LytTR family DNA-binding domain-containing protein [unclassified Massilia]ALK96836.1 LytR family transcriptional regulator [Massilia sp. WG5]KLU38179.1 LytR family transcriptional regulator [Massilia sp. WF1]